MARARFLFLGGAMLVIVSPASLASAADVTCYVDSVGGDDGRSGLSEAAAVRSQSKIDPTCTIARFKRGSVFNEALKITSKVKTYANYGDAGAALPQFVVARVAGSGSIVSAYQGGITVDGLFLAGSMGDGTMTNLAQGICVMLGSNSKLLDNEITNCDIGIMLNGPGALVQGNYIHDLHVVADAPPGVDPNLVGGAEGIFINASNNEVAYNTFVNCRDRAEWTGGNCDGGATEVTVGAGATLSGVKVHHNFSYNSCGFFEVSSGFGASKGTFADSTFYNNVIIDSGWLSLLQVNNTNLSNIRWENNTLVQHRGSVNAGILAIVYTDTSSGVSGGSLLPNSVFLINNLFVFDGVPPYGTVLDPNFAQTTNLIIDTSKKDPGFVDLAGTTAEAFALTASSPAVNAATAMPDLTLDYLNRAIPDPSGLPDIGAFEHGSADVSTPPGGIGGAAAGGGSGGMAGSGGTSGAAGASGSGGTTGSGGRAGAAAGVVSSMGCSCSLEPAQSRDALPLLATALAICALIRRAKPHADHPCRQ